MKPPKERLPVFRGDLPPWRAGERRGGPPACYLGPDDEYDPADGPMRPVRRCSECPFRLTCRLA